MKQNHQSHCLLSKELMQMSKFSRQASTSLREATYRASFSLENNMKPRLRKKTANKIIQDWFATKVHTDLSAKVPDCCRPSDSNVRRIQLSRLTATAVQTHWDPQMSCVIEPNQLTKAIQAGQKTCVGFDRKSLWV